MANKDDFESIDDLSESPKKLPYSTAVLVLGIISIVTCWLYVIPGTICGIIGLVLAAQDKALYEQNPNAYKDAWKNTNAGKVCNIIGLALNGLFLLVYVWVIYQLVSYRGSF